MRKPIKFATETETEIERLLDGEPLERILPNLNGNETPDDILRLLQAKLEKKESQK